MHALLLSSGVRLSLILLAACGSSQANRPAPIPAPCTTERIGSVTVTGASRAAVPALVVLEGTLDDAERTARIAQSAAESLHWRGYAQAKVEVRRRTACFTDLEVAVTLGVKYQIASIEFETRDEFPAAQRLAALEDTLGTVNTIGGVLIAYRLSRALTGLERRYRDAGWLDVEIGTPVTRYVNDEVHVSIPVTAGARYRVGAVRALGANERVRQQLLVEWGIEPGSWYDAAAIKRALDRAKRTIDRRVKLRASALEHRHEIELEAIVEAAR